MKLHVVHGNYEIQTWGNRLAVDNNLKWDLYTGRIVCVLRNNINHVDWDCLGLVGLFIYPDSSC